MKGIIFNLLERVVVAEHGEDTWDDLLDAVGSDGVYSAVGQYDDEHLVAIVHAASAALGLPASEVLRWFGQQAIPLLVEAYPAFFTQAGALRPFLLSLNDVIHSEVRKLYPGAVVPEFDYVEDAEGRLGMTYRSPRSMCHLAIGFAEGAAAHFGESAEVVQTACKLEGTADDCVIEVRTSP